MHPTPVSPGTGSSGPFRAGLSRPDVLIGLASAALLALLIVPVLGQAGGTNGRLVSAANLARIGDGLACYAFDWNDRQFSTWPDDIAAFGSDLASAAGAYENQVSSLGYPAQVGWRDDTFWFYVPYIVSIPVHPRDSQWAGVGTQNLVNVWNARDYIARKFYDPVYYAPLDSQVREIVEPSFDSPWEFDWPTFPSQEIFNPTYTFSAAALYHPDVFRPRADGGFQEPFSIDHGLNTPTLSNAKFPSLKTWMLEERWLTNDGIVCNDLCPPKDPEDPCNPVLFNQSAKASPMTLFYDGSVSQLDTGKVAAVDQELSKMTGTDGLWSRDSFYGPDGYFGECAIDGTNVSHHVLTTGGIRGRDTLTRDAGGSTR